MKLPFDVPCRCAVHLPAKASRITIWPPPLKFYLVQLRNSQAQANDILQSLCAVLFHLYDADKDGQISADELTELWSQTPGGEGLSAAALQETAKCVLKVE